MWVRAAAIMDGLFQLSGSSYVWNYKTCCCFSAFFLNEEETAVAMDTQQYSGVSYDLCLQTLPCSELSWELSLANRGTDLGSEEPMSFWLRMLLEVGDQTFWPAVTLSRAHSSRSLSSASPLFLLCAPIDKYSFFFNIQLNPNSKFISAFESFHFQ